MWSYNLIARLLATTPEFFFDFEAVWDQQENRDHSSEWMMLRTGGFHSHGGTPIAGWFLLGKIPSRNDGPPIPGWFIKENPI